jgi:hypothetical protein
VTGLPRVRVEVGFTSPFVGDFFTVGDPERGQVGVSPIGPDGIWSGITAWVRSWSYRRGVNNGNQPTRRYEPGTCTVVLNDPDRRFDPDNLDGPFVTAGRTEIEPMRRLRILAEWGGKVYPLFYGYTDDWIPEYLGNSWTYVTVTATDGSKLLDKDRPTAVGPFGNNELTGARIDRVLTSLAWPFADRIIDTGATAVQATALSGNGMSELQLVQDTELGEFYIDVNGKAVFRDRLATLTDPRSTLSQVTFGDGGYDATGELPYLDTKPSNPSDGMANTVTITRVGGAPQQAIDADSVDRYLERPFDRSDLIHMSDSDVRTYADAVLYRHANPGRRFAEVTFQRPRVAIEDVLWPAVLGRDFGDRITVIRRPSGGGSPIEQDCFIRGVGHASEGHRWDTTFVLENAQKYSFFTIGHPDLGQVGVHPITY